MEAQLEPPSHHHEQDPQNAGLHPVMEGGGEGEQHQHQHQHHQGEKKSVLKKVKDKAKKIKDTIKKHGHGHDHDHDHDDDSDEEMVNDHEVHGAPMYESTVIRSVNLPKDANPEIRKRTDDDTQAAPELTRDKPISQLGSSPDPNHPKTDPLVRQFDNINVGDDSGSNPQPGKGPFNPESNPEKPETNPKSSQGPSTESKDTIAAKISSTTSAVADKALSAKNVVASKLGYGVGQEGKPVSESATEYAHIAAEKLAPVYEKIAGAGTAVMSKVQGGSGGGDSGPGKGSSVREYLAEKFRPGDEDRALSEAITDTLSKKGSRGKERAMGKVTESEEVAARLGRTEDSKREGEDAVAAGEESSGRGVMDRVIDAVGLWLGKSEGMQTSRDSIAQSHVSDPGSGGGGGVGRG